MGEIEPDFDKILLRAKDKFGVTINELWIYNTNPKSYSVLVNGVRVHLKNTKTLLDQERFAIAVAEQINVLPRRGSREHWEIVLQVLFEFAKIVDVSEGGPR